MRSNPGKANEASHLTMRSIFHPYKGERYCAHPPWGSVRATDLESLMSRKPISAKVQPAISKGGRR